MPRRLPTLLDVYNDLHTAFGPQHWWPGETPFEVVVGAVLVQNTSWRNVERAISNLREHELLDVQRLARVTTQRLERLLRPAGYYRVKAKRLGNLLEFLVVEHEGSLDSLFALPIAVAREQLLSVNGVGPETADSILLYAGNQPKFVVDAYTKRVLVRHGWLDASCGYDDMQQLFEQRLDVDVPLYNEFHALIVRLGNEYCRAKPKCDACPLRHRLPRSGPRDYWNHWTHPRKTRERAVVKRLQVLDFYSLNSASSKRRSCRMFRGFCPKSPLPIRDALCMLMIDWRSGSVSTVSVTSSRNRSKRVMCTM